MSTSSLKPSKNELRSNLDRYRIEDGSRLSDLEFHVLCAVCEAADKAMRLAARTALKDVPEAQKDNLFPRLTGGEQLPMATEVGEADAFRISIPISFVAKLLLLTPTRDGRDAAQGSDYFTQSTYIGGAPHIG